MTFQLDTTGAVFSDKHPTESLSWDDLSPFTQGYIEALFATFSAEFQAQYGMSNLQVRFSDLAPETLARIIADCASFENIVSGLGKKADASTGYRFWNAQQIGLSGAWGSAFPPLTVQLGDDGKVRFA